MLTERHGDTVVIRAPAKVNLFLEVLGKRADGYHEIATLMVAVGLYDTLEFRDEPAGRVLLACDHTELSTGSDNLVCRAAALLRQRTGCARGASIRLTKRIPLAAGLAGGSRAAAAAQPLAARGRTAVSRGRPAPSATRPLGAGRRADERQRHQRVCLVPRSARITPGRPGGGQGAGRGEPPQGVRRAKLRLGGLGSKPAGASSSLRVKNQPPVCATGKKGDQLWRSPKSASSWLTITTNGCRPSARSPSTMPSSFAT